MGFIKNLAEYLLWWRQDVCVNKSMFLLCLMGLSPMDKEVRELEKARTCAFQANFRLIWAIKYRRKVLVGTVEVRLEEVLKTIASWWYGKISVGDKVSDLLLPKAEGDLLSIIEGQDLIEALKGCFYEHI